MLAIQPWRSSTSASRAHTHSTPPARLEASGETIAAWGAGSARCTPLARPGCERAHSPHTGAVGAGENAPDSDSGEVHLRPGASGDIAALGQPGSVSAKKAPVVAQDPVLIAQGGGMMLAAVPSVQLKGVGGRGQDASESGTRRLYEEIRLLPVAVDGVALVEAHVIEHRPANQGESVEERCLDRIEGKHA